MTPQRTTILTLLVLLLSCGVLQAPAQADAAVRTGVQAHVVSTLADDAEMDRQLTLAAEARVSMMRVDISWATLQVTGPDRYEQWYLERIDALVAKAESRGIEVLFTLLGSPCWASSAPPEVLGDCSGSWWERPVSAYPPRDPQDYADALALLVDRYGPRVRAWEIWNEPNLDQFFRTATPEDEYAALLKVAYRTAKAVDPEATIIGGVLAHADYEFADALLRRGIAGHFDAFSIHPYANDQAPSAESAPEYRAYTFSQGVPAVRDVLLRHGQDQPLWLTEFGWSTTSIREGDPWRLGVDESTQARYLTEAYEIAHRWDFVEAAFWYTLVDGPDPAETVDRYGLTREDGSRKSAFYAMQALGGSTSGEGPSLPELPSTDPVPAPTPGTAPQPAPAPDPVPAAAPAPAPSSETSTSSFPAKLQVLRAQVDDGHLDMLVEITARADGDEVDVEFHARGERFHFTERVEDGRLRVRQPLPAPQRRAASGIVTLRYGGNDIVRPSEVRLRAARGKARLGYDRDKLSVEDGVLRVQGKTTDAAQGIVRLLLSFERADGSHGSWEGRARIEDGSWKLEERLPEQAAGGGYLTIQFTGYLPSRLRGEQVAKQVLAE